ncbi:hypothetical protein F2Q69_00027794 [Brassica cretica]|uniref:Uncharacterized protein n=1 Tax=Brassica cretica TaxID=69181 RepID=A0A8S9S064_BRACR|nr:hypothetical protein F2Q69_00027794 [Brassica cretica]
MRIQKRTQSRTFLRPDRSLRSDRAWLVRGPMAILELVCGRFGYVSVAFGQSVFRGSIEIRTRFYRKALRKDLFTKITFRKNVLADFYGLSDIDSVVTDFDPNMCKLAGFLKTLEYWPRDKVWDLVSGCLILCLEMLETSVLGLGQDLGLITALGGAMTTSTYVFRIIFDLIPSCFKVCDMFSAYVTCMDVFTQIAKDVVGRGLDHGCVHSDSQGCCRSRITIVLNGDGKFWFEPLLEGVIDRGPKSACRD